MLRFSTGSLSFPPIIGEADPRALHVNSSSCDGEILHLDWSKMDEEAQKRFDGHPLMPKNITLLPAPYESWLQAMVFKIPKAEYLFEIRRHAECADREWTIVERGSARFDTVISEACLRTSIAHAHVAFMLLDDCLIDPDTQRHYTGPRRLFSQHALLYRFWANQGGRHPYIHSDMKHLEKFFQRRPVGDEERSEGRAFLDAINKQEAERYK